MNNASFMFILISEESKLREYINVSSVSEKKRIWQRTGYKLECFFSRNEKWEKIEWNYCVPASTVLVTIEQTRGKGFNNPCSSQEHSFSFFVIFLQVWRSWKFVENWKWATRSVYSTLFEIFLNLFVLLVF